MDRFFCDNDNCSATFPTQRGLSLHAKSCPHAFTAAVTAHAKRKADINDFVQRKKARLVQNEERLQEATLVRTQLILFCGQANDISSYKPVAGYLHL